jgi:ribonuclease HII
MKVGIDEAGRGSWAGPLIGCAIILNYRIVGLNDSKVIGPRYRQELAKIIKYRARSIGVGWVFPTVIDEVGLTRATSLAMQRALEMIMYAAKTDIVIDGNYNYLSHLSNTQAIISADKTIPQVSAASIIAKTLRDEYMKTVSRIYPDYGFEKHKGYGTAYHHHALKEFGPTPVHRMSFKPVSLL